MSISKCSVIVPGEISFLLETIMLKIPFFPEAKFGVTWIDVARVVSEKPRPRSPLEGSHASITVFLMVFRNLAIATPY